MERGNTGVAYDERMQGTLQLFRTQAQVDAAYKDIKVLKEGGVPFEGYRWRTVKELNVNYVWLYLFTQKPAGHRMKSGERTPPSSVEPFTPFMPPFQRRPFGPLSW